MSQSLKSELQLLEPLIGIWKGEGRGFGSTSVVENTFQPVLQGHFLRSESRSVARNSQGEVVEIHEDLGMFSYDPDRETIILREFYTEGYVYTYVLEGSGDAGKMTMVSEHAEGAGELKARLRFHVISSNDLEVVLDLAKPGEEFCQCQIIELRRIQKK